MVADAVKSNLTNVRVICLNRLYFHNVSDKDATNIIIFVTNVHKKIIVSNSVSS
jgi:hypothetical protein